jgi:hypothetical protein
VADVLGWTGDAAGDRVAEQAAFRKYAKCVQKRLLFGVVHGNHSHFAVL